MVLTVEFIIVYAAIAVFTYTVVIAHFAILRCSILSTK